MEDEFYKSLIKEYKYWSVYVHGNQGYLGRCVIWCKRENALDLTEATSEEQQELFVILNNLRKAVMEVFQPDWLNYAFLGNAMRHLHGHFIPRYAQPKTFMGVTFKDERYGHNYKTDHSFETQDSVLMAVKDELKKVLQ